MSQNCPTPTDLIAALVVALAADDALGVFYAQTALVATLGEERTLAVAAELLTRAGRLEEAAEAEMLIEQHRREGGAPPLS